MRAELVQISNHDYLSQFWSISEDLDLADVEAEYAAIS